jgi:hypothetical protein
VTDLATALADTSRLSPFEGQDVLGSGIEIPNAAGGLQQALKIDPQEFHHGDKRYVVLEVDCEKVRFDPIKDTAGLRRVHVFSAKGATFVDADLVSKHVEDQRDRILRAKEAAAGVTRLEDQDGLADEEAEEPDEADGE